MKIIKNYLMNNYDFSEEEAIKTAERIERNKYIESEFIFYASVNSFPSVPFVTVNDYSAEFIYKKYDVTPLDAYLYLSDMSIDFEGAVKRLHEKEHKRIAPPIQAVYGCYYNGMNLIRKYKQYYIRFRFDGYICDLLISEEEAIEISEDKSRIEKFLRQRIDNKKITLKHFIHSELKAYLMQWERMSDYDAEQTIDRLSKDLTILKEFYFVITEGKFPPESITVNGIDAQYLFYTEDARLWESYAGLIWLKEDPQTAMSAIKETSDEE